MGFKTKYRNKLGALITTNSFRKLKFETGGPIPVSQLYTEKTGKPWSTAKEEGLTDGSYASNIKLRESLLAEPKKTSTPKTTPQTKNNTSVDLDTFKTPKQKEKPSSLDVSIVDGEEIKAKSFADAFKIARTQLGSNKIFKFRGRSYGTNIEGEKFEPSEETLKKSKLDTPKVKERLEDQNAKVVSPYTTKDTVKLEPDKTEWSAIKKRKEEFNKMDQAQRIISYRKDTKAKGNYVIVDKKKGLVHIYEPGQDEPSYTSAIDLGASIGDAQTVTKVFNPDGSQPKNAREAGVAKANFAKGNKSTGAGRFFISNIDPKGYEGQPLFNMMNERQYEKYKKEGVIDNVSTSFHKGFIKDDEARVSNGCLRCSKPTLDQLVKSVSNGTEVYILPEDEGNEFVLENGKLNFRVKSGKNYNDYIDSEGNPQEGQGINRGQNSLNYIPIKISLDEEKFKEKVFTAMDFNDEEEYTKTTKPFVRALQENKRRVMQAAEINGDVYNDIAKIAFGIYGTESNFGDTHTAVGNLGRAARKWWNPKGSSSPDTQAKATTYRADKETNSVGLTQIRFSYLNKDEKEALKKVGITKNTDFMEPRKAAIGTAVVLGVRYNQQLNEEDKKDIMTNLPKKWNNRPNYSSRVKSNSSYLTINQ